MEAAVREMAEDGSMRPSLHAIAPLARLPGLPGYTEPGVEQRRVLKAFWVGRHRGVAVVPALMDLEDELRAAGVRQPVFGNSRPKKSLGESLGVLARRTGRDGEPPGDGPLGADLDYRVAASPPDGVWLRSSLR